MSPIELSWTAKKTLRKYWENFFRNYALFYMQGVGIFTEITVHGFVISYGQKLTLI